MKIPFAHKKQRGQSLMEMALFLMIILWLLAGAVDFGMAYFSLVQMRDAAQEGVIYGSIHPADTTVIRERVWRSSSTFPIDLEADANVIVCPPTCTGSVPSITPGNPISVTVTYNYNFVVPLLSTMLGETFIPLHATATGVMLKTP